MSEQNNTDQLKKEYFSSNSKQTQNYICYNNNKTNLVRV